MFKNVIAGVVVATTAYGLTLTVATPHEAAANERRVAGVGQCSGWNITDNVAGAAISGAYVVIAPSGVTGVNCNAISDSHLRHTDATALNVHAYVTAPRSFYACVRSPWSGSATCGSATTSGSGYVTVAPDRSRWTNGAYAHYFPYVSTTLEYSDRIIGVWYRD